MKIKLNKKSITIRAEHKWEDYDCENVITNGMFDDGKIGTIATKENTNTGKIVDVFLGSEDGICGNANPGIKSHHGWRGTYNDTSTYAHGLAKITSIENLNRGFGFKINFKYI